MDNKPNSVSGKPDDDHSSRMTVTRHLQRPTRKHRTGSPQSLPYLVLLRMGFAWLPVLPREPVSSYLTVSPLPSFPKAVCFLLRFPQGCPHRVLPGIPPYGVRTFLSHNCGRSSRHPEQLRYIAGHLKKQELRVTPKALKYL